GERAAVTIAADGQTDDPRAFPGKLLGTEAVLVHDAGTVALAEHVYVPPERPDRRRVFRTGEIQVTAPLAVARVHDLLRHLRQVLGAHHQPLGAVFRQRARGNRPGEYAGEIEPLDSRERSLAPRKGNRITVGNLRDLDERPAGQYFPVRMLQP